MSNASDELAQEEIPAYDVEVIIYLGIIMVLGCVGNAFVCYVYFVKLERTAANLFVAELSFCDFLGSLICIPLDITVTFLPFMLPVEIVCRIIRHIIEGVVVILSLVVLGICVTRFRNVVVPQRQLMNHPSVYLHVAITSTALCLPCFYVYSTLTAILFHLDLTDRQCPFSEEVKGHKLYIIFLFFVSIPVLLALFTIYCLLGNANIYFKTEVQSLVEKRTSIPKTEPLVVNRQSDEENTVKKPKKVIDCDEIVPGFHSTVTLAIQQEAFLYKARTTLIMSLVSLSWLFCFLPHVAGLILLAIIPNLKIHLRYSGHVMFCIGLRSFYFKNAANPWIYGVLDYRFRQEMSSLLQKKMMPIK